MTKEEIERKYTDAGLALACAEVEVGKAYIVLKKAEQEYNRLWKEYMEVRRTFLNCLDEEKQHESTIK